MITNGRVKDKNIRYIDTPLAAKQLCERLIDITADLISVLDQETNLVRNANSEDFTVMSARKQALSMTLMHDMELLNQNADYIKMAAPEQVLVLQEQQDKFNKSLEINHHALSAMKAVSEGLLQTIAAKAAKRTSGPDSYNNDARIDDPATIKSGPVSIDARL